MTLTDPTAQIILVAAAAVIASVLAGLVVWAVVMFFRRRMWLKAGSFAVGQASTNDGKWVVWGQDDFETFLDEVLGSIEAIVHSSANVGMERKMDIAERAIAMLRESKEKRFYQMLVDAGVPHHNLGAHCDAQFYIQALGCALYIDNGTLSVKSMVRREMRAESYRPSSDADERSYVDRYGGAFARAVIDQVKRYMSAYYKTDVMDESGTYSHRLVTAEMLYDSDHEPSHYAEIAQLFANLFREAIKVDQSAELERGKLIAQRKRKLMRLAGICATSQGA